MEEKDSNVLPVNEIFKSFDGEGKRTGETVVFIRFQGCNLKCSYCDTQYACKGNPPKEMTIPEIVEAVEAFGIKKVTITGGEPLLQQKLPKLVEALGELYYEINIETNGSIEPPYMYNRYGRTFFTYDWKSKSSGMEDKMHPNWLHMISQVDVVKFVVSTVDDMVKAKEVITQLLTLGKVKVNDIYISPVFNKITPEKLYEFISSDAVLNKCRMQVQLHKIVYDPERRGV